MTHKPVVAHLSGLLGWQVYEYAKFSRNAVSVLKLDRTAGGYPEIAFVIGMQAKLETHNAESLISEVFDCKDGLTRLRRS